MIAMYRRLRTLIPLVALIIAVFLVVLSYLTVQDSFASSLPARSTRSSDSAVLVSDAVYRPAHTHMPVRPPHVMRSGRCDASYYSDAQMTASGQWFNPNALTAASPSLRFGTHVRVIYGRYSVTVTINDRGPYVSGRCLDLSLAAMRRLHGLDAGVVRVTWQVLAR